MRLLGLEIRRARAAEDGGRANDGQDSRRALKAAVRARHPRFLDALVADARVTAAYRGDQHEFRSRAGGVLQALRLMLVTDAFLGLSAYRLKARLQARGIPVLPWIAHRVAMMTGQISIGEYVVVEPGILIPHGQVVVNGLVQIQSGAILLPWVTVDMIAGEMMGPTIGAGSRIGTGAKVLGPVEVGANSRIAPNAVVLNDVPAGATVVGMPARAVVDERELQARKQEPPLARHVEQTALPSGEEARDPSRASRGRALPPGQQEPKGPGDRETRRLAAGSAARTPQGDRQRAAHRGRGHAEGTATGEGQAGGARALKERPERSRTERPKQPSRSARTPEPSTPDRPSPVPAFVPGWLTGWRGALIIVAALTLVGFVVRALSFGESLFGDELSTYWILNGNDLGEVLSSIRSDDEITPPLYFVFGWFALELGAGPEWVRLPSLIAGTATIPLIYLVGKRAVGRGGGLIAAGVIALGPFMIYYSTEARAYAVMIALLTASTLALLAALRTGRTRWWVLYAICSCAAMYSHYTSVFPLAAQFAWAVWFHRGAVRPLLLANLVALVAFAPWIPGFIADTNSPTTPILSALEPFTFDNVTHAVAQWSLGYPYLELSTLPGTIGWALILAGCLVAAVAGARRGRRWLRNSNTRVGAALGRVPAGVVLVVMLAVATPIGEALYSALGTDLLGARNLNASWPGLALSIGALISAAGIPLAIGCAALVLAGMGISAANTLGSDAERAEYAAAADWIEQRWEPGDVVVDAVAFTPVPLTGLDVHLPQTHREFRLGLPVSNDPFLVGDAVPSVPDQIELAVDAAEGRVLFLVAHVPTATLGSDDASRALSLRGQDFVSTELLRRLGPAVNVTDSQTFPGVFALGVFQLEGDGSRGER